VKFLASCALLSACSQQLTYSGSDLGAVTHIRETDGTAVLMVSSAEPGGRLSPGEPVQVLYLDAGRALIVQEPQVLEVDGEALATPPEAAEALLCFEPASPPAGGGTFGYGGGSSSPRGWPYRLVTLDGQARPWSRFVDFTARARSRTQADALALLFLKAPWQQAPPQGITVGAYALARAEQQGLYLLMLSLDGPTYAAVQLNSWSHQGLPGMRLGYTAPWWCVMAYIPWPGFQYRPRLGGSNHIEFHLLNGTGTHHEGVLQLELGPSR